MERVSLAPRRKGIFRLFGVPRADIGAPLKTGEQPMASEHLQQCVDRLCAVREDWPPNEVRLHLSALRAVVESRAGGALCASARVYAAQIEGLRDPMKELARGEAAKTSRSADQYRAAVEHATDDPLLRRLLLWLPHDSAIQIKAEDGTSLELRHGLLRQYMAQPQ